MCLCYALFTLPTWLAVWTGFVLIQDWCQRIIDPSADCLDYSRFLQTVADSIRAARHDDTQKFYCVGIGGVNWTLVWQVGAADVESIKVIEVCLWLIFTVVSLTAVGKLWCTAMYVKWTGCEDWWVAKLFLCWKRVTAEHSENCVSWYFCWCVFTRQ